MPQEQSPMTHTAARMAKLADLLSKASDLEINGNEWVLHWGGKEIDDIILALRLAGPAVALIDEALEPGVFGEPHTLDVPIHPELLALCQRIGYGAVMQQAAAAWERKTPGCGHSVAACTSIRDDWIQRAKALSGTPNKRRK